MFRWVLATVVAVLVSRSRVASAICAAPPCQRICETAPMSAYYRAEVAGESSLRLLERLGGNSAVDPPIGLLLDATLPLIGGPLAEGSPLLVSITSPAYDTFDAFDVVAVQQHYPSGESVCDGLALDEYMAIATSDRCDEIAREQDLVLTECHDTPARQRGCASTHGGGAALALLAVLLVRRRTARGATSIRTRA